MTATNVCLLVALSCTTQVPPPTTSARAIAPLRERFRQILDVETQALSALANRLETMGSRDSATVVRETIASRPSPDGRERFLSIPEVVPASGPRPLDPPSWTVELGAIREKAANELFALAGQAVANEPRHHALADTCLREVVARDSDHAEARRLLGQVRHNGGWATPYAVRQFGEGKVPHPVFGWVKVAWVPHLVRNELPAPGSAEGRERWLPADEADALRREFSRGWRITTEHFSIQTNVPLSEAITFGRHLETLHEVFESLFADVLGDSSALAQRFRKKDMTGERPTEVHAVSYFAERSEYAEAVRIYTDVDPTLSLGYYHPPQGKGQRRGRAYFFRDPGGDLAATTTLFHEGSHMLLFESGVARAEALRANVGNYWVFEGLGTFFETLEIGPDGVVRVGGLVGPRNAAARSTLARPGALTPLTTFITYGQDSFNDSGSIVRHYQQAAAFTSFLMGAGAGRYRDGFVDYVRDACAGRLGRTPGRSLAARLDTTYPALQTEFVAYLRKPGN